MHIYFSIKTASQATPNLKQEQMCGMLVQDGIYLHRLCVQYLQYDRKNPVPSLCAYCPLPLVTFKSKFKFKCSHLLILSFLTHSLLPCFGFSRLWGVETMARWYTTMWCLLLFVSSLVVCFIIEFGGHLYVSASSSVVWTMTAHSCHGLIDWPID